MEHGHSNMESPLFPLGRWATRLAAMESNHWADLLRRKSGTGVRRTRKGSLMPSVLAGSAGQVM